MHILEADAFTLRKGMGTWPGMTTFLTIFDFPKNTGRLV